MNNHPDFEMQKAAEEEIIRITNRLVDASVKYKLASLDSSLEESHINELLRALEEFKGE